MCVTISSPNYSTILSLEFWFFIFLFLDASRLFLPYFFTLSRQRGNAVTSRTVSVPPKKLSTRYSATHFTRRKGLRMMMMMMMMSKTFHRPLSQGGHFEFQENKKLCFCPSSLAQHCVIKFYCTKGFVKLISSVHRLW